MIGFSSYVHSLIPALKHASKNKILIKTFVLMSHLLTSREIIFKLCSKERYLEREQTSEEQWKFPTWKVHWIMNSYTNSVSLFQSSTYSITLWKSLSGLLQGWAKTDCPLLLLANLCLAILLGEEWVLKMHVHSLIGEHSWTGVLNREIQCPTSFRPSLIQIKVGAVFGCLYGHEFYPVLSQVLPETQSKHLTCWIPDIAWEQLAFQTFFAQSETKVFFFNRFVWHWLQRTNNEILAVKKSDW